MSSGSTSNLGLNQWELTDPFLMAEMNSDNQKLDAAVGGVALVKLGEIVTTAQSSSIVLDLSQIDKSKYSKLIIDCDFVQKKSDGTASNNLWNTVTVNDQSSGYKVNMIDLNSHVDTRGYFCYLYSDAVSRFVFHFKANNEVCFECDNMTFISAANHYYGKHASVTKANLASLKLVCGDSNERFFPGSVFKFYGVKK